MLSARVYMLAETPIRLPNVETMGSRITVLREARGLSVVELAAAVGVTRALVWQWEQDLVKGIRPENFIRLCHALNVTPEYLIWGPDRAPQDDPPASSASGRYKIPRPR